MRIEGLKIKNIIKDNNFEIIILKELLYKQDKDKYMGFIRDYVLGEIGP